MLQREAGADPGRIRAFGRAMDYIEKEAMYTLEQVRDNMETTELTKLEPKPVPKGVALIIKGSVRPFKTEFKARQQQEAADVLRALSQGPKNNQEGYSDGGEDGEGDGEEEYEDEDFLDD